MAVYIKSHYWDFGDGETSTEENPNHTYKMPGTYTWTYTVTDMFGLSSTITGEERVTDWSMEVNDDPNVDPNGDEGNEFVDGTWFNAEGYVIFKNIHTTYTNKCIRHAIDPTQGVGMVEWGGKNWLWPEGYVGTCNGYDLNNEMVSLVLNTLDGQYYRVGRKEQWLDKLDNVGYVKGFGYEINTWVRLKNFISSMGEFQDSRHIETYVYMRPFRVDRTYIGAEGYNEEGFRLGFKVGLRIYKDSKLEYDNEIKDVPLKGDYVYRKKVLARLLGELIFTSTSAYRCVGVQQRMEEWDKIPGPEENTKSETTWEREFNNQSFWVSRDSTRPIMNRSTAQNVDGSYDSLITGPDTISNSALFFGATDGLSFTLDFITESTLCWWISDIVADCTIWAFEGKSIQMVSVGGKYSLRIHNGTDFVDIDVEYETGWMFLAIRFEGDYVRIFVNGNDFGRFGMAFGSYGGATTLMNAVGGLFDPRQIPRIVSKESLSYYYEVVTQQKGNTGYLPTMR